MAEPARRILTVNCGDDAACSCRQQENLGTFARNRGVSPHSFRYNIAAIATRTEQYQGREHLVVPVVMARSGVVMNGALVTEDEFFKIAEKWDDEVFRNQTINSWVTFAKTKYKAVQ